jgi:hypothetical protein
VVSDTLFRSDHVHGAFFPVWLASDDRIPALPHSEPVRAFVHQVHSIGANLLGATMNHANRANEDVTNSTVWVHRPHQTATNRRLVR